MGSEIEIKTNLGDSFIFSTVSKFKVKVEKDISTLEVFFSENDFDSISTSLRFKSSKLNIITKVVGYKNYNFYGCNFLDSNFFENSISFTFNYYTDKTKLDFSKFKKFLKQ